LFPRYLFALFDRATTAWLVINGSRGVVKLLTDGLVPVPIPEDVVEKLLSQTDADGVTSPAALQLLSKGCTVRLCDGVFAGQLAEVDSIPPGNIRVNLLLGLLGRVARLQVPICAVEPV
jgi:transcription antitermination factor NusG